MKIDGGKNLGGAILEFERSGNPFSFFGSFAWFNDGGRRLGHFRALVQFYDAHIWNFPAKGFEVTALLVTFFKENGLARVGSQVARSRKKNITGAVRNHDAAA
jgi:hypothetical protein